MRELHTDNVAASVAADLVDLVERRSPAEVHIALTGGRVGTDITTGLVAPPASSNPPGAAWSAAGLRAG